MNGVAMKDNMTDLDEFRNMSRKYRKKLAKRIAYKNEKTIRNTAKSVVFDSLLFQMVVAHEQFGFGRKRLEKLFVETVRLINRTEAGEINTNELTDGLKNKTGFDLNYMLNKYHDLVVGK